MDHLPFGDDVLDVIWLEGTIYTLGFEAGLAMWRRHLKSGGVLVANGNGDAARDVVAAERREIELCGWYRACLGCGM